MVHNHFNTRLLSKRPHTFLSYSHILDLATSQDLLRQWNIGYSNLKELATLTTSNDLQEATIFPINSKLPILSSLNTQVLGKQNESFMLDLFCAAFRKISSWSQFHALKMIKFFSINNVFCFPAIRRFNSSVFMIQSAIFPSINKRNCNRFHIHLPSPLCDPTNMKDWKRTPAQIAPSCL